MKRETDRHIHDSTNSLTVRLTVVGLVLLCINPSFVQGHDNMNILLNIGMCLSPFVLLIKDARTFIPRIDLPLCTVIITVLFAPFIFHPDTVRLSTMLFTCAYCVYFMMLALLVKISGLGSCLFLKLIRVIVYTFAVVLVIQQLCVLMNLPVPLKAINYYNPWKLNSLTAEPSHTTVILSTLLFFYTRTLRLRNPAETLLTSIRLHPWLWIAYLWTLFTTDNASAYIMGPLCLLPYITRKNIPYILILLVALLITAFLVPLKRPTNVERVLNTITAVTTLNDQEIIKADTSASARLVPTLRGARALAGTDMQIITGHGVDADQRDLEARPCDVNERGFAGIFSIWYNYGVICSLAFWISIGFVTIIKRDWMSYVTFAMTVQLSADYNMQLGWMIMAFAMVFKYSICGKRNLLSSNL
ncbi:MAG: hypothetical protein HDS71_07880 [Bacteroidales bacterium]|nr:hypothetical protein [Bacteroidales bacterium]